MLNVRITHCTDGVEKVIEITDKDVDLAFATRPLVPATVGIDVTARFVDNGDGTVTDTTTRLMWTKDNVGDDSMNHDAATSACKVLEIGGHKDWRLPTRAELLSLVDDTRHEPAIDVSAFPSCKNGWYWSATPCAWASSCAWFVAFYFGGADGDGRDHEAFVRAVRAAPAGQ